MCIKKQKIKMEIKNIKGFTVIELLVTMVIIGILATVTSPLYNSFQYKNDLLYMARNVDSLFNKAYNSALTSQLLGEAVEVPLGYGILIDTTGVNHKASLYLKHKNNINMYFENVLLGAAFDDEIVEEIEFTDNIVVADIQDNTNTSIVGCTEGISTRESISSTNHECDMISIAFAPPYGTISFFNGNNTPLSGEVGIVIIHPELEDKQKKFIINKATERIYYE